MRMLINVFLSIQYSSSPYFPTPYLCNWDFRDPDKTLKYIMKHFNGKMIHNSLQNFPNLAKDFIYANTLQQIDKSIIKCNASFQKWSEQNTRYIASDISPLTIICVLESIFSAPALPWTLVQESGTLQSKIKWNTWIMTPSTFNPPQYYGQQWYSSSNTKQHNLLQSTRFRWRGYRWMEES